MSDLLLRKKASVERCIRQARDYYAMPAQRPFAEDSLKQDAIAINLLWACEQCIDMANHVVLRQKLGMPPISAESFALLRQAAIIDAALERKLVGHGGLPGHRRPPAMGH